MAIPSTSEHLAANRGFDVGKPVCHGIGVDVKREYQSIHRITSESKPAQASESSVCNLASLVSTTRNSLACRRCQGADLPPQQWNGSWGPQGRKFWISSATLPP